jgi:hypothetical protein
VHLNFSPDGRYFLAGTSTTEFAYDLAASRDLKLPSSIRNVMHATFTFVDSDSVLGLNDFNPAKSPLLKFPTGEHVRDVRLAYGLNLEPTAHGRYVAIGPLDTGKRGFIDPTTGKMNGIVREDAGDIYDDTVVYEERDGRILLIEVLSAKILARAQQPNLIWETTARSLFRRISIGSLPPLEPRRSVGHPAQRSGPACSCVYRRMVCR